MPNQRNKNDEEKRIENEFSFIAIRSNENFHFSVHPFSIRRTFFVPFDTVGVRIIIFEKENAKEYGGLCVLRCVEWVNASLRMDFRP